MTTAPSEGDSQRIVRQQRRQQQDEQRTALRALLMSPLMGPQHEALPLVRRHAEALREWFQAQAGWPLLVERDGARLFKRPADLDDPTRGLPRYERQRYVLLCLACAVLERAESQITLRALGERLLAMAADPLLAARGFSFALQSQGERRALVAVCQTLLDFSVLHRVAGDEESFVQGTPGLAQQGDALYDVRRRALAGMLAAVRGPSTWPAGAAPVGLNERLASLVQELVPDSDDGRRQALRQHLARRLLDDPVVYLDSLDDTARAYFVNQRGVLAARLAEATGLVAEQRAEGSALTDEGAELSDLALPAEGTESHATLLVAEHLAARLRQGDTAPVPVAEIATFLAGARATHGRFWRKAAREPGGEHALAAAALQRLASLQLLRLAPGNGSEVVARPALARYTLGDAVAPATVRPAQAGLFGTPQGNVALPLSLTPLGGPDAQRQVRGRK
jgi:uncharacterized protein (TIGR02678 family)